MTDQNVTKCVSLTPQLERWVFQLIASGDYKNVSEVIRDALRALRDRRHKQAAEIAEIEARIAKSLIGVELQELGDEMNDDTHRYIETIMAR